MNALKPRRKVVDTLLQRTIPLFTALSLMTGCSKRVVLTNESNTQSPEYECGSVRHQAESPKEIEILVRAAQIVMKHAQAKQNTVTIHALDEATKARDFRTMEDIVVDYYCRFGAELTK